MTLTKLCKDQPDKTVMVIVSIIILLMVAPAVIKNGLAAAALMIGIIVLCYVAVMAVPVIYAYSILKKDLQEKGR